MRIHKYVNLIIAAISYFVPMYVFYRNGLTEAVLIWFAFGWLVPLVEIAYLED